MPITDSTGGITAKADHQKYAMPDLYTFRALKYARFQIASRIKPKPLRNAYLHPGSNHLLQHQTGHWLFPVRSLRLFPSSLCLRMTHQTLDAPRNRPCACTMGALALLHEEFAVFEYKYADTNSDLFFLHGAHCIKLLLAFAGRVFVAVFGDLVGTKVLFPV